LSFPNVTRRIADAIRGFNEHRIGIYPLTCLAGRVRQIARKSDTMLTVWSNRLTTAGHYQPCRLRSWCADRTPHLAECSSSVAACLR